MGMDLTGLLREISSYAEKPPLWEAGEKRFWDDEYISIGMLDAHLNQQFDAASRRFEIIDREIEHLLYSGVLRAGDRVLDLGCGPGLYASRLCNKGLKMTGIDISRRSIEYARKHAGENNLDIDYLHANFVDIGYNDEFEAVMQVYGEINTLRDADRDMLLSKVRNALVPDGLLIFDVSTRTQRMKEGARNHWHYFEGGLWRPGKHMILEEGYDYPEDEVWLDQYIVIDENGLTVYRDWYHDYSLETILDFLESTGFSIVQIWNDLTGTPYKEGGDWIAVVARKA